MAALGIARTCSCWQCSSKSFMVRPAAVLYFWSGMDDPALRGLLRRLRTGQGTRVSCAGSSVLAEEGEHRAFGAGKGMRGRAEKAMKPECFGVRGGINS